MDLIEFLQFLITNNIDFTYESVNGEHIVRVVGEKEDIISFNGEKKKCTPYIRVSGFGTIRLGIHKVAYVRDNGICEWRSEERIKEDILKLAKKGE